MLHIFDDTQKIHSNAFTLLDCSRLRETFLIKIGLKSTYDST